MFEGLTSRLGMLRQSTVTGIGLTESNFKMVGVVLAPFLGAWFVIKTLLPPESYDLYIMFAFGGWLVWVVMVWAWAKSDANNFLIFAQSKWKFPNGDCRTFDLKVPADSWELLEEFETGEKGYKVAFDATYQYDDPNLPFARLWRMAYWILPALWDESFARRAFGEFFHKGVSVTKPDCEDISVYVIGWETMGGQHFPVCLINDCALAYQRALRQSKVMSIGQASRNNALLLMLRHARKKVDNLGQHTAYLEDRVVVAEKDSSEDFKESADNRMKAVRKRHARVMDTKESLWAKFKNLKTVGIAIIIIAVIFFAGRFLKMW